MINNITGGKVPPFPKFTAFKLLRNWWHEIIRNYGKYSCSAVVLALPNDTQVLSYLSTFGRELDLISGENCLVIAVSDADVWCSGFDEIQWNNAINAHVFNGESLKIAKLFNIAITEFPCLVIFQDIRSSKHLVISLKDMIEDEIAQKMRFIFSVVQTAINKEIDPLLEIKRQENKKELQNAGSTITGNIRAFANNTVETVVEAWIESMIKTA